jgi:serine/threonine-protein kinase
MTSKLGHYDIVEELGRGGMGVVYKGYEPALGRYVAIKVLATAMAHDPVFVERFLREARSMATLSDPNIIQIYFIGQDEDQVFFAMEFIEGDSLSGWIKREGKLATGDALKVLLQTSKGLAAAHAEGVIHRDIKPGNIMINTRGVVKVADFGIALASNDISSSKLTSTGALVGTPGYLPPEVCLGRAVDQRSDIFALGIVLFETLTGRMPFNDASPLKLMLEIVESDIPDIRQFNPDVDDEAVRILGRMLEKNPSDRYQSCDELCADLHKHPLATGPLTLKPKPVDQGDKATMIGVPTHGTGGHKPPRGATPPPQVGARTQPVMAAPSPGTMAPPPQPQLGATVQTGHVVGAPAKKSLALPIAIVALLVLAGGGYGGYRYMSAQAEAAAAAATAAAAANAAAATTTVAAPTPPVNAAVNTAAAAVPGAIAGSRTSTAPAGIDPVAATGPAAASLQPADGAVPVNPATSAQNVEEMVAKEVARRERLAAQQEAARKKRQAAAAAAANNDDDETVSDDDGGGATTTDARALRKAYLCRTQHRC